MCANNWPFGRWFADSWWKKRTGLNNVSMMKIHAFHSCRFSLKAIALLWKAEKQEKEERSWLEEYKQVGK